MGLRNWILGASEEVAFAEDTNVLQLEHWIKTHYITDRTEIRRRDGARARWQLYKGCGTEIALKMLAEVFQDSTVLKLRAELAPYARYNNLIRRITDERARVYARPAKRYVDDGLEEYRSLQRDTMHDAAFRLANKRLILQNDVWVGFAARESMGGVKPRIDVVGPENFFVITSPRSPTTVIGVGLSIAPRHHEAKPTDPHWLIWSEDESYLTDDDGRIMRGSWLPNPLGRLPGVLIHSNYRDEAPLDPLSGEDLINGHLAAWFLETLTLKESKSLGRQAFFLGDTRDIAHGQVMDSERDGVLGEGVGVTTVDRGVDLEKFRSAAQHVVETVAANHGIPPSVLHHQGATSGFEIELRRIALEEQREDQIDIFREAERQFAEVEAAVVGERLPAYRFAVEGWRIDFAEVKRPLSQKDLYDLRKIKRAMGHSDAYTEAMDDNPDLDETQAREWVTERIVDHLGFISLLRELNAPAMADADAVGRTPQENGALNRPAEPDNTDSTLD